MNAPQHTNSTQGQGAFPAFKSERLAQAPNALVLWGNTEATGPHVKGKLTKVSPNGEQFSTNVSGFFKISEKGDVRVDLSSRQENGYTPEGTLYVQRGGDLKFYPKDKAQPQMVVRATDAMPQEVADAIGVTRAEPRQSQGYGQPQPQTQEAGQNAAPAQPQPPAVHTQAQPAAQRPQQNVPPSGEGAYAWDEPVKPPVQTAGGRPRFA